MSGLSVLDALRQLNSIDRSLDAFVATAPQAVEELGGIEALRRMSQTTCVGPIPRLTADQWAAMAAEQQAPHASAIGEPVRRNPGMGVKADTPGRQSASPAGQASRSVR